MTLSYDEVIDRFPTGSVIYTGLSSEELQQLPNDVDRVLFKGMYIFGVQSPISALEPKRLRPNSAYQAPQVAIEE